MKKLFSYQIMKQSFKSVWLWWVISIVIISVNMFAFSSIMEIEDIQLLSMFAENGLAANGITFITVCVILFTNVFITSEVDRGTLAITLNTPTTRLKILLSKALVYIVLLSSICLLVGVSGTLSALMQSIEFDHLKWWIIIVLWLVYSFAIGGIAFCIGCWFNKSRYMLGLSSTILGMFFVLNMFSGIESIEVCKYFTLQTLFDISAVINGESVIWHMVTLLMVGFPLYIIGIAKFLKKDLPL